MAELNYRQILDVFADAVVAADATGRIVYANAAAERLLGSPAGGLLGQPLTSLMPPRMHAAHQAGFARYLATRVPTLLGRPTRVPAVRRDGTELDIELTLAAPPLPGQQGSLFVASMRDLGDRVELERQLRVTRFLRAAARAVATLSSLLDLERVLATVVDTLVADFDAALARVWLYEAETNSLHLRASAGLAKAAATSSRARIDVATYPYKVGEVARSRRPIVKNGLMGDPHFEQAWVEREGLQAMAAFPLLFGGELKGVLACFFRQPLPEELVEVLATFAVVVTTAVHDVQLFHREQAARAEAQRTARHLEGVLACMVDGVLVSDATGRIVLANDGAARIFGVPREALLRPMAEYPARFALHAPEGTERRTPVGVRALAGEVVAPVERTIVDARGATRWLRTGAAPLRDERGTIAGSVIVIGDITDQKRGEQALRETGDTLRAIVDASPLAIVALNPEANVMMWNPAAERIFGWRADEVLARPFPAVPGDRREEFRARCQRVLAGEAFSDFETRRHRKDGLPLDISLSAAPLRDPTGAPRGIIAIVADIAERKRAEVEREQLLAREQAARAEAEAARRRAAFLAEASAILTASLDYEATLASVARLAVPAMADWCFVDLPEGDRATRRLALAYADPSKARLARELGEIRFQFDGPHPIARALRTGQPELVAEVTDAWYAAVAQDAEHRRRVRELGSKSNMFVPLVASGRTLGVMTFTITDSGRRYGGSDLALAEEVARRAALAIDNARLFRDAQEAIRQAQAAVRARDTFLARASHELRTPLTSALGTARLLRRARPGQLPESPEALLAVVDRSLTAMAALVEDLLDASKLAAGQEALTRERVDLAEAVGHSLEVVGPQAREKGVAVRVDVPAGLALSADRLKLEQVLVNLLANAVKFTPPGGEVTVRGEEQGGDVVLRVRDTGDGIAPDQLERIFEPFYQAGGLSDSRVTDRPARRIRGTGLGLAICRQVVTLHGGRIWAESEGPGRGSTFVVRLPAAPAGSQAA